MSVPDTADNLRDQSLDALRVFALFAVIALHSVGVGYQDVPLALAVDELTRFAVPTFFALSGFFWRQSDLARPGLLVAKVSRRVLPAYFSWLAVYWLIDQIRSPDPLLIEPSLNGFVTLFWMGDPGAYHLWYLPALVVGATIAAFSVAWLGLTRALLVGLALYAAGLLMGSYGKFFDVLVWKALYRNGVFFAPIFLLAGIWLRQNEARVRSMAPLAVGFIVLACARLQLLEADFLKANGSFAHDFGIPTLFYGIAMLVLFLTIRIPGRFWSGLGALTFSAYLAHPLVMRLLDVWFGERPPFEVYVLTSAGVTFAAVWTFRVARNWWTAHSLRAQSTAG